MTNPNIHQLSDELERYIRERADVAENAWGRLLDMTLAELRFQVRGKELTEADMRRLLRQDEDPGLRSEVYEELGRVFGQHKKIFALIVNTLVDLKAASDECRGFRNPEDSCSLQNQIDPASMNALMTAIGEACSRLSHRYYAWKAEKFGGFPLHPANIRAPLPEQQIGEEFADMVARRAMMAAGIEDMLDIAVQAAAVFSFEKKVHLEHRARGELPPKRLAKLWRETQQEVLGPAVDMDVAGSENLWMAESSVFQTPFLSGAGLFRAGLFSAGPEAGLAMIERHIDALEALDRKIETIRQARRDFSDAADDIVSFAAPKKDSQKYHPHGPAP